ncbi:MAG: ATP-binding protein [Clostridiales bacterium]|nr:ATP-binding protein [Clostridiales bacterium]
MIEIQEEFPVALKRVLMQINQAKTEQSNLLQKNEQQQKNLSDCPLCKGTGWIINDFDKRTYTQCNCAKNSIIINRLKNAGLNQSAMRKTFKTYDDKVSIEASKMKDVATGFVIRYQELKEKEDEKNSLALLGQSGAGKTHLLIAIINNLATKEVDIQYFSYPEIMTHLKQVILDEAKYSFEIKKFKKCELLVIDDLFKNGYTEADKRIMFEIINSRVINKKPIAISSELLISDLCRIDEAFGSRIKEVTDRFRYEILGNQHNYRLKN